MEKQYKYYAFISYKREDEKWAKWLQKKIEYYHLPVVIRKSNADLPRRLKPVFLDQTDIQPGFLENELSEKLAQSKYLIVICSPLSAQSKWVGKEITDFIALGGAEKIIPFIIDGIPYSNDPETECIHPVLKEKLPELLGVNINELGKDFYFVKKEKAFIRVISKILDVSFDSLWKRHRKRRVNQAIVWTIFSLLMIASMIGVWKNNQPFNATVRLNEVTINNLNLPFENGYIAIVINSDTITKEINCYNDLIQFNNIAGKFYANRVNFIFEMYGYHKIDTVLSLTKEVSIPIQRDNSWGAFFGQVVDEQGQPVKGAEVIIAKIVSQTNDKGIFRIDIPLDKQKMKQEIVITKQGYKLWKNTSGPSDKYDRTIMLVKK